MSIRLTVETDATASECNLSTVRHYVVANAPPVADAGKDRVVGVNEEVLFDGSASGDPDGALRSWSWDFGDGTLASGMVVRHRFRDSGRYPVTLTVTDDTDLGNNTATATQLVTVNAPPAPVIAGPGAICPGEVATFDGRQSDGCRRRDRALQPGASATARRPRGPRSATPGGRPAATR